jgi:uncharacterized protein YoxC
MPVEGILYIALVVFLIILAIAWIILPFAIIGTKPLLQQLLAEARMTNQLLRETRRPAETRPRGDLPIQG